ncbi:hypothetical protein [Kribbella sp. NPDC051718]|uniref:hypothetical protein n=1 Tax=Kribbella sp. NPDC051718 TaxID=3155168 RepID=UPI00341374D0
MRLPATTAREALFTRLKDPAQTSVLQPDGDLPPYMESFLAHLRLLVGVPFEYLIPDDRMLPPESIRFFYVDRSWTDRLVDGGLAVGQIGSREEAHYQARGSALHQLLDQSERMVRNLQRGKDFYAAKAVSDADQREAKLITGFLLRSSAVKQWPHMDVRGYDVTIAEPFETSSANAGGHQLKLLRLELLAPSLMIALFETEPKMVILEEPHHGVQFGVRHVGSQLKVPLRDGHGQQIVKNGRAVQVTVPTRKRHSDVIRVAALREALIDAHAANPTSVVQEGSGSFAISVLDPPWRQHFEGTEDFADTGIPSHNLEFVNVTFTVQQPLVLSSVKTVLGVL